MFNEIIFRQLSVADPSGKWFVRIYENGGGSINVCDEDRESAVQLDGSAFFVKEGGDLEEFKTFGRRGRMLVGDVVSGKPLYNDCFGAHYGKRVYE